MLDIKVLTFLYRNAAQYKLKMSFHWSTNQAIFALQQVVKKMEGY